MPCRSDYSEQSGHELESIRVCKYLTFVLNKLKKEVPLWVVDAANSYSGNTNRLDEATKVLCETLRSLTFSEAESIVYNAHSKESRDLANWWEQHQEWDKRRVAEEQETRRNILLKDRALKKLSVDERRALGLLEEDN
jgi:hypothetical protein